MSPPWSCAGGPPGGGIAGDASGLYTVAGALLVTLPRSKPRQAYRIYSEEEFLAAEDWQVDAEPELALLGQASPRRQPKRWGGLAALVALTTAVVAVVGVVALNATRSKPQSNRRIAARRGSPPQIVADRPGTQPPGEPPRSPARRASVLGRRIAARGPHAAGRPTTTAHPHRPPPPTPPTDAASEPATAAPETPTTAPPNTTATPATASTTPPSKTAPTTAASTAAPATPPTTATASTPVAASTATGTTSTATGTTPTATGATSTANGADAEFGFERR